MPNGDKLLSTMIIDRSNGCLHNVINASLWRIFVPETYHEFYRIHLVCIGENKVRDFESLGEAQGVFVKLASKLEELRIAAIGLHKEE